MTFTPDDLELAKGSMAVRRAAIDALGSQLSANHYLIRRDYEKVLRHKNRLLKDEAPASLVAALDETLVMCGAQLACYRARAVREAVRADGVLLRRDRRRPASACAPAMSPRGRRTTLPRPPRSPLGGTTRAWPSPPLWPRAEARSGRAVGARGAACRPASEFFIDGRNVSSFASQGQQRSVVLAFKLAEAALVQDILHQKPVLLLDDVMSELDAARRRALVAFISGDIQTFITTANLDYFDDDPARRRPRGEASLAEG